ncbi:hypothetical protein Fcan01_27348 [Folsomia candida]|uniref:F-box domain-containing protein n=1 Tax=Folsomia candida TaxID=158441 RepID=A0A226CY75_FOLCA|nr:hypothetical protein Fcan01_27348 [Folsomia candida]
MMSTMTRNLDIEASTFHPLFPEIIERILSFLPTVDLLTSSSVNATWEREARKQFRARIPIKLTGSSGYPKFEEYITLMSVRNNYHERLHTCYRYFEEINQFLSKLEKLALNSRGRMKHLSLPFIMQGGPEFRRFFEILHLFGHNLSSLELHLCHNYHYTETDYTQITTTTADVSPFLSGLSSQPPFPWITRLSIRCWSVMKNAVGLTVAKLGPLFPNVTTLEYLYPDRNAIEMQLLANPFPRLSALRISDREYETPDADIGHLIPTFRPVWSINKFEFNVIGDGGRIGMSLLRTFSPTLESVHINKMHIRLIYDYKFVFIPVMPRLRGFRVTVSGASKCNYVLPQLQFETQNAAKKIVYDKQFPVLQRIRVGFFEKVETQAERETQFETIAKFLYGSFLSGANVCDTLDELDVPLPPGEVQVAWREGIKMCVVTTFPNVRYSSSFDEMWRNMRRVEVQKWIESGIELGVLGRCEERSGDIGGRDERLVYVEIGGIKVKPSRAHVRFAHMRSVPCDLDTWGRFYT